MKNLYLCATGKSGLGHLRRLTNIATELSSMTPGVNLHLVTNAPVAGLTHSERVLYRSIHEMPRDTMACFLKQVPCSGVMVDTAVIPGIESLSVPLILILRETVHEKTACFALPDNRPWDLLLLPNPEQEWHPQPKSVPAIKTQAVGWIYRTAAANASPPEYSDHPCILIAFGGGGKSVKPTIYQQLDQLLEHAYKQLQGKLQIKQLAGPRDATWAPINKRAEFFKAGSKLHEAFHCSDLVISAVGYNSVLELAGTSTPVLFVPVPRTYDDQYARARRWAPDMGKVLEAGTQQHSIADWLVNTLRYRHKRPSITMDMQGAHYAAQLIAQVAP